MNYPTKVEAASLILDIGKRMYNRDFVAANDGNISCRISDGSVLMTPTGVSKGYMTENMLVNVSLDGELLSTGTKPSSEVKMHLRVFKENPNMAAVTHAHPPHATACAVAGMSLDMPIIPEAVITVGTVPCVPYELTGTQALADSIAPYCQEYYALLLANHGAITWGRTVIEAFYRLEVVEHYAKILMYTKMFGKMNTLSEKQVQDLIKLRS